MKGLEIFTVILHSRDHGEKPSISKGIPAIWMVGIGFIFKFLNSIKSSVHETFLLSEEGENLSDNGITRLIDANIIWSMDIFLDENF